MQIIKIRKEEIIMRKTWKKFGATVAVFGLVASTVLTGCGSKEESVAEDGVTKIIVGTGNGYSPYCYLDDSGNLAGYEYEVLKAVDELLPQYEFEFQTSDFTNILISLDAGKIDIAAHQYEYNDERASKYLFGEEAYTTFVTYLVVPKDNTTIQSLDDLQGKTAFTGGKGSNSTYIFENYNKEHSDNPITLVNADSATSEEFVQGLLSGNWDAATATKRDVEKHNTAYGSEALKTVGEPLQSSSTYYIFDKNNVELKEAVDGALRELKESGRLAEISIEQIGGDYTESE